MAVWPDHPQKIHRQISIVSKRHFFRPLPNHHYRPNPLAAGQ